MMLHSTHLTLDYPPMNHGGISTALDALVHRLKARGIETGVVSYDNWRPSKIPASGVIQQEGTHCWRVMSVEASEEVTSGSVIDSTSSIVVHHPMLWSDGWKLAQRRKIPIGFVVHVDLEHVAQVCHRELTLDQHQLFARIRSETTTLFAPSTDVFDRWRDNFPSLPIIHAPLPIRFKPISGVEEREPTIVSVGRLDYVKGADFLPALVSEALAALPEWRWCHVGGNPASPKTERRWIKKIIDGLDAKCQSRFEFRPWTDADGIARAFHRASLMVAPSRYETYGLAVREALSHGVPVIAFDSGGIRDCIESGSNGVLISQFDLEEMMRVIIDLARDDFTRRQMGAAASKSSQVWHHDQFVEPWITELSKLSQT